ncbi:MAG TPA: hypothetical protein VGA89_00455 [Patescibacteria group bacterium]|jgi:hypothetical protein
MQIPPADQLETPLSPHLNPALRTLRTAVLLTIAMTALTGIFYSFLQPEIPLFYTLAQPREQLVHKAWIFFFPVFAWTVSLGHFILIKSMAHLAEGVRKTFSWTTLGLILITGLLLVRTLLLVL